VAYQEYAHISKLRQLKVFHETAPGFPVEPIGWFIHDDEGPLHAQGYTEGKAPFFPFAQLKGMGLEPMLQRKEPGELEGFIAVFGPQAKLSATVSCRKRCSVVWGI